MLRARTHHTTILIMTVTIDRMVKIDGVYMRAYDWDQARS